MGADYKKRIKDLIRIAEDAGWIVDKSGGGHWRFLSPDKRQRPLYTAATSSDRRGILNFESDLKKAGLDI